MISLSSYSLLLPLLVSKTGPMRTEELIYNIIAVEIYLLRELILNLWQYTTPITLLLCWVGTGYSYSMAVGQVRQLIKQYNNSGQIDTDKSNWWWVDVLMNVIQFWVVESSRNYGHHIVLLCNNRSSQLITQYKSAGMKTRDEWCMELPGESYFEGVRRTPNRLSYYLRGWWVEQGRRIMSRQHF